MRSFLMIGYPESIFKFALSGLFKNAFRKLPRRALCTARNDEYDCLKWLD
ncbi:MAG: hypothetical protein IKH45_00975 [Neisseriaceae bacterium]|nr:hypothetical protein [Neisseriaceae bacterium]